MGVATPQRAGDQFRARELNEIGDATQPRSRPDSCGCAGLMTALAMVIGMLPMALGLVGRRTECPGSAAP